MASGTAWCAWPARCGCGPRNGKDFTAKFPDIHAALSQQVSTDCVLDGELVVWTGERMDFDALQCRCDPGSNLDSASRTRLLTVD